MQVKLTPDEVELLLSCIGIAINLEANLPAAREQLEALQTKLMAKR